MPINHMDFTRIGRWAFIGGIVLAILAGFTNIPFLTIILFILGLVIGFLNIKEKESTSFLVAVIALLVIGIASLELGKLAPVIMPILSSFIAFVSAAGLVVAIKQVLMIGQQDK